MADVGSPPGTINAINGYVALSRSLGNNVSLSRDFDERLNGLRGIKRTFARKTFGSKGSTME